MRLTFPCCLLLIVLFGANMHAWGKVAVKPEPVTAHQVFIWVTETDPDAPPMGDSSGGWLSHDATGFVDGPNLYAYVKENPWSAFDPKGLDLQHIGQAWMSGDFSLQTFVGEGGLGQAVLHMPAPNDVARQVQHAMVEGNRIAAIAVNEADKNSKRGTVDHAVSTAVVGAGLIADHLIGTEAIGEAISGERTEVNSSGQLHNRQLGTAERVTKGLQGAIQVGALFAGARATAAESEMAAMGSVDLRLLTDQAHATLGKGVRYKSTSVGEYADGSLGVASSDTLVPRVQREWAAGQGIRVVNGEGHAEMTLVNGVTAGTGPLRRFEVSSPHGQTASTPNGAMCRDCAAGTQAAGASTTSPSSGRSSRKRQ